MSNVFIEQEKEVQAYRERVAELETQLETERLVANNAQLACGQHTMTILRLREEVGELKTQIAETLETHAKVRLR